jgi:hypothetical protein
VLAAGKASLCIRLLSDWLLLSSRSQSDSQKRLGLSLTKTLAFSVRHPLFYSPSIGPSHLACNDRGDGGGTPEINFFAANLSQRDKHWNGECGRNKHCPGRVRYSWSALFSRGEFGKMTTAPTEVSDTL